MKQNPLKLAVLCGGPSPERGISLNSARSACDHLEGEDIELVPIYFDLNCNAYQISRAQLYSNTPSDFDFKLRSLSSPLSRQALSKLFSNVDLVFPVMHGKFGEDGTIQELLEKQGIPYIASPSKACRIAFDKYKANLLVGELGLHTEPALPILPNDKAAKGQIERFFKLHKIRRGIVKPASGGSSIGVHSVSSPGEALKRCKELFKLGYKKVICEKFCVGREFTVVLLENKQHEPVALLPVEIETDYSNGAIFDYRKKYLPSKQATYHCPARFPNDVVASIQRQAESIFKSFGMRDFARFDGWYLDNGKIWFSDFNPISGMEQNSFLFIEGARVGLTHRQVLRHIVSGACRRYGLKHTLNLDVSEAKSSRKPVNVIFGGLTAERQVSVMSGTNVWLKLIRSQKYDPKPYLLDVDGKVWRLPYSLTLSHTVEEMSAVCRSAIHDERRNKTLRADVIRRLGLPGKFGDSKNFLPQKITLKQFINESRFVFLGLHGGIGEDGTLQSMLDKAGVLYNGSGPEGSVIGMDKYLTGEIVTKLNNKGILSARREFLAVKKLFKLSAGELRDSFKRFCKAVSASSIIVKPVGDGCSAGVARLYSPSDLVLFVGYLKKRATAIPARTLSNQPDIIELPIVTPEALLFEEFIETDRVSVGGSKIIWKERTGWIEITVGVLGPQGKMRAMNPSMTIASGDVLSVEEKFQGGTGINITPPPEKFVSKRVCTVARRSIEIVAKALKLRGYARIDAFLNRHTGAIYIIEANTLPGLTPSTVIYHQALAEQPQMYPREFLERVIKSAGY